MSTVSLLGQESNIRFLAYLACHLGSDYTCADPGTKAICLACDPTRSYIALYTPQYFQFTFLRQHYKNNPYKVVNAYTPILKK